MVTKGRTNSIELHTHTHTHTSSSLLKNKKIEEGKIVKSKTKEASLK